MYWLIIKETAFGPTITIKKSGTKPDGKEVLGPYGKEKAEKVKYEILERRDWETGN